MIFLLTFFSSICFGFSNPDHFDSGYLYLENSIHSEGIRGQNFTSKDSPLEEAILTTIFEDKKHRIHPDFTIPKYFEPSVHFWFDIYTQYSSKQAVIHDLNNLKLIYNVIDFSELFKNTDVHRFSKAKLQSQLSMEYTIKLRKILKRLSYKNLRRLNVEDKKVLTIVKSAGTKIPKSASLRKRLFLKLSKNIRIQSGQRDKIFQGVIRSLPYQPFLKYQLKNFKLPEELLAISFLESSFNPNAKSKVAASGVWQFMPFISNLFMPKITKNIDYRSSPIISSIAAFHLLKENKGLMKRWDLAVTAYNSGTKHLRRAQRNLSHKRKKSAMGLDYILKNYKHAHLGFASKNFYSEFLALTRVLAYKEIIYPLQGYEQISTLTHPQHTSIYISKCKFKAGDFFEKYETNSPLIKQINAHIENKKISYPRGTLLVSDKVLPKEKFYRLTDEQLTKKKPKHYNFFIKKKKCES